MKFYDYESGIYSTGHSTRDDAEGAAAYAREDYPLLAFKVAKAPEWCVLVDGSSVAAFRAYGLAGILPTGRDTKHQRKHFVRAIVRTYVRGA